MKIVKLIKAIFRRLFPSRTVISKKCNRKIADDYFKYNPQEKNGVMKAYYAYHSNHFRVEPTGHNFSSTIRTSKCHWCGRSREQVRHDDLPAECQRRPLNLPDIQDTILSEEYKAFKLFNGAEKFIPKFIEENGLTGKSLSILHHTHGYDINISSEIIDLTDELIESYNIEMNLERNKSIGSKI